MCAHVCLRIIFAELRKQYQQESAKTIVTMSFQSTSSNNLQVIWNLKYHVTVGTAENFSNLNVLQENFHYTLIFRAYQVKLFDSALPHKLGKNQSWQKTNPCMRAIVCYAWLTSKFTTKAVLLEYIAVRASFLFACNQQINEKPC